LIELTIVAPTFNEAENAPLLVGALHRALDGVCAWEIVFVDDDSPDGTAEIVKAIARTDGCVRCLHRIGRRGLSSACIEGALSSAAPYVLVMDADLQHDPVIIPALLRRAKAEDLEVVVASRYLAAGGAGDWSRTRLELSRFATRLALLVAKAPLSDPLSGFFLVRRQTFTAIAPRLAGEGFKILLDLFASAPGKLRYAEEPYTFALRQHGQSKLDEQAAWAFLMLLAEKSIGKYAPVRFLSFALIGASGVIIHVGAFLALHEAGARNFEISKVGAVLAAIVWNYTLNNAVTYRDRRRRGWRWLSGLASFLLVCSVGAAADVGVSSYIYNNAEPGSVWRTLSLASVLAGLVVGAVWNYAGTQAYTWPSRTKR